MNKIFYMALLGIASNFHRQFACPTGTPEAELEDAWKPIGIGLRGRTLQPGCAIGCASNVGRPIRTSTCCLAKLLENL